MNIPNDWKVYEHRPVLGSIKNNDTGEFETEYGQSQFYIESLTLENSNLLDDCRLKFTGNYEEAAAREFVKLICSKLNRENI